MTNTLKTAGKLIANTTGEEQGKLLSEAFKQFSWEEIKEAVEEAEKEK